jgi:ATP-dependent RNA helicase SUPV3L1/SUV3
VHIDEQENIFNDTLLLGTFDGFLFKPSDNFEQNQEIDNFVTESFIKKIDKLINDGDAALRLNEQFYLTYNDAMIAKLLPTEDIFKPDFTPILDDRIQGIPLARLALHLESWLKRQLNAVCDPLDILTKTEDLSEDSIAFIKVITEYLGYAPRHKIDTIVKKIAPNDRTKLRKAGVRFAQYSVFVRDMLKPSAQKIKLILWSLKNNIPLPELPPSGVVTIPFNPNVPEGYYDIAGYKVCGDYCVRADMIEKLADAIRPLATKSDNNPNGEFEITAQHMSFIGKSGDSFDAVLKGLGYNYRQQIVTVTSASITETKIETEVKTETDTVLVDNTDTPDGSQQEATPTEMHVSDVVVTESQIEKKIWFWSPVIHKPKRDFKNTYNQTDGENTKPRFHKPSKDKENASFDNANKNSDANSSKNKEFKPKSKDFKHEKDAKNDKLGKPKHRDNPRDKNRNDDFKQDKQSSPYVNMPKTHKVAAENNPFAALLALKK